MVRVLFVCMGNICRSPVAAGALRRLVDERGLDGAIEVDSAGTSGYHVGEPADDRAAESAGRRGFDISAHRARRVSGRDFQDFDYVIAMDRDNYDELLAVSPSGYEDRISLLLQFAPHLGVDEVPDPYYGGPSGFEHVLDLVQEAAEALLEHLAVRHGL
jgi:protein-tyrosine phosphatase